MSDRPRLLRAGPLSAELVGADLRVVRVHGVEIVRRITVALRDSDWGTARATVEEVAVDEEGDDGFAVAATVRHDLPGGSFRHTVAIHGRPDGRLSYRIRGRASQPLRTNRVGLCVLHPPATCEGRAYRCERDGGGDGESGRFPGTILPQRLLPDGLDMPPLTGIRTLTLDGGITFAFEGPLFCLEDQRNWTDASYKCCTDDPPDLPLLLDPADEVVQGVVVTSAVRPARPAADPATRLVVGEVVGVLPPIGPAGRADELARSGLWAFAHLEVHDAGDVERAAAGRMELELRLPIGDAIAAAVRRVVGSVVEHVVVVDLSAPLPAADDVNGVAVTLTLPAGAGAPGGFVGISTYGLVDPAARSLWWTACPQVHAHDDRTILENATCQGATVRAARALAPGARTSVTLRFAPAGVEDARAQGVIGAAWLAASVAALATAGADAVSVAAAMLAGGPDSPPAAVMRLLAARAGSPIRAVAVGDELAVAALGIERGGEGAELLLVNLRDEPADVAIAAGPAPRAERLAPYAVRLVELD